MDLFTYLDSYCERTAPGVLNEPLNAATNLAFFIAGYLYWRRCKPFADGAVQKVLLLHFFLIGGGSLLFHTFANTLTVWMDVLPILGFQLLWLWIYLREIARWHTVASLLGLLGYLGICFGLAALPDPTHGSIGYLGPLLAITAIGIHRGLQPVPQRWLILHMAALFVLSLSLRTLDLQLCQHWPFGTHFLWHCLNGVVLLGVAVAVTPAGGEAADGCTR